MLGVRMNTFNDVSLGEPEQDANSALTELDKGLRSSKVGEQCEAIVRFPHLFEKYPFPILINASLLKLADVFRVGNNFLRLWILKVCQQSEKHLDKVLNVEEFVRRIFSVIHSNDPVARALTLRTLGSIAGIIPELQHVHHSIRRSLDSHDAVEVEAAIYAANQFAAQSKTFALSMCNKMSDMIQGLTTPAHMKLQLIPILQHMHHDTSSAAMVRQLCIDLLPKYPAQDFVPVILRTLTRLALATSVDIPNQVTLLLKQLHEDDRPAVQHEALLSLRYLAAKGAHLWPVGALENLVSQAMPDPHQPPPKQAFLSRCLDVLLVLAKSAAACHSQLHIRSPLMQLCIHSCYSNDPIIAVKAVQVYTRIVCYSHQGDSNGLTTNGVSSVAPETQINPDSPANPDKPIKQENSDSQDSLDSSESLSKAGDAVESLLLLLTVGCNQKPKQAIKICLHCAITLCKTDVQFCSRFVQLIGTCLLAGCVSEEICEALGAIGNLQPSALLPLLHDILAKLSEMAQNQTPGQDQSRLKVMLCTLVFQCAVGYDWHPDALRTIKNVASTNNQWANFRIMRSAARYGHHAIAADLVGQLKSLVSSDNLHFWLVCLEEMSLGEAMLQDVQRQPSLEARLSQAVLHYSKSLAALKAASTPAQTLQFQSEYLRLRGEFLQLLVQLVHSCHSFCTTPPAAIATSIAQSTRDDLQRYGHITHQLRKCTKEFRHCGEQYWNLYQSAFDADSCSLAHIQILQQMCVLVAHSIERVALANFQEEASFDCSLQQCSLETQHLVKCCREAVSLAQTLTSNRDLKPITHLHIECLLKQIKILAESSLCVPRYFFQVIQSTSVKLVICPQPRVQGESVTVQAGSQLAIMVEGVIQHGKRPGVFRSVSRVVISVTSQLQSRTNPQHDTKPMDTGSVLTQTVTPHRDFFTSQFLLAFHTGGTYLITVEASLIDEKGNVWRTGLRNTLTVKSHEEPGNKTPVSQGVPVPGAPIPGAPRGRF